MDPWLLCSKTWPGLPELTQSNQGAPARPSPMLVPPPNQTSGPCKRKSEPEQSWLGGGSSSSRGKLQGRLRGRGGDAGRLECLVCCGWVSAPAPPGEAPGGGTGRGKPHEHQRGRKRTALAQHPKRHPAWQPRGWAGCKRSWAIPAGDGEVQLGHLLPFPDRTSAPLGCSKTGRNQLVTLLPGRRFTCGTGACHGAARGSK